MLKNKLTLSKNKISMEISVLYVYFIYITEGFMGIVSVKELFDEKERVFFIPSYQRGYRWGKREVEDLLDDILDFSKNKEKEDDFYCLQPIVIKDNEKEKRWEVIDGQQRLTTLYLILRCMGYKDLCTLEYETRKATENRKGTQEFLKDLFEKSNDDENIKEEKDRNIDFYHIYNAYNTINNKINSWDKEKELKKFKDNILDNVRVIWYEADKTDKEEKSDSIEIFTRINTGKIPLTNSELIRALFFMKSDNKDNIKDRENYQSDIAFRWEEIENRLQDNDFWFFLNKDEYIKEENKISTRIDFIFKLIAEKYKEKFNLRIEESDTYYVFDVFDKLLKLEKENIEKGIIDDKNKFPNKKNLWNEVDKYFSIFEEWYKNDEYYNIIGYLIHTGKEIKTIKKIHDDKNKDEFKTSIMKEINIIDNIKNKISQKDKNPIDKLNDNELLSMLSELSYSKKHNEIIQEILLLFNVITTMVEEKTKFKFDKYIEDKWSLEHIHAQNSQEIKSDKDRREVLKDQYKYFNDNIKYFISSENIIKEIKELLESEEEISKKDGENDLFTELQNRICKETTDIKDIHGIGNLALLQKDTNSKLSNHIFLEKSKQIKTLGKGNFIPICTKKVFHKEYNEEATDRIRWNESDREAYLREIATTLQKFLNYQGE